VRDSSTKLFDCSWYIGTVAALLGIVCLELKWQLGGTELVTVGIGILAVRALVGSWHRMSKETSSMRGFLATSAGGALFFISAGVSSNVLPTHVPTNLRVVALATGAQALLLAVNRYPTSASRTMQWIVPLIAHSTVLAGSVLAIEWGPYRFRAALLAYAVGSSLLALHVFWMQQLANGKEPRPDTMSRLEAIPLVALIVMIAGTIAASLLNQPYTSIIWTSTSFAAVVAFATLVSPPTSSDTMESPMGTMVTVSLHAVLLVILVNALMLAVLLIASWAFPWVLSAFYLFLVLAVLVDYLAVAYAHRRQKKMQTQASLPNDAPVTIVVAAANEAEVLPESLAHNLETLSSLPFIVVPAVGSEDATVEVARKFNSDYPNRVQVVEGTAGSKAGDLNLAWDHIDTPYAIILDADETIDAGFITRGLRILRENPDVGLVQGRKAAAHPSAGILSRFVSAERRHSTWVDHPFMADIFNAGHFGGSAAIFRREVPPAVDGWRPDALTEDIDFTLRLYLRSDWQMVYESGMVAKEAHPATLKALVRQRVRWARGWAQAAGRYGGEILRSRDELGWHRTLGVEWLLFNSGAGVVATIFPVLILLRILGLAPSLPYFVAIPLAVVLLPARAISFGYATLRDPAGSISATPARVGKVIVHAYLWIILGWGIQLHALYLQLASAPKLWYVTEKTGAATSQRLDEQNIRDPTTDD